MKNEIVNSKLGLGSRLDKTVGSQSFLLGSNKFYWPSRTQKIDMKEKGLERVASLCRPNPSSAKASRLLNFERNPTAGSPGVRMFLWWFRSF